MDLLANDLSIHEQFHDISSFRDALARLMSMRNTARTFGREVHCNRRFPTVNPIPNMSMQQAIGRLDLESRRATMSWMTHTGPFWDDLRQHGIDDWLECSGEVVTDTAVGEAAFRTLHGSECGLVSVTPSDWNCLPIDVIWRRKAEGLNDKTAALENWWDPAALQERLRSAAVPTRSWADLNEVATNRFPNLVLAQDCFEPLDGMPFVKSAAERFLILLGILDRLAHAFDADGVRTAEGHRIYQDYFTGGNALFSDSSNTEKRDFRNELTFPHPNELGRSLFCTWHGKVRHMTLRLHYWWSGRSGNPVFVIYAGPKITKR